jgi:hypothetical protein
MTSNSQSARQFETFAQRILIEQKVSVVLGADGFARVPSAVHVGRDAVFVWTRRAEARKWADALVRQPRIETVPLDQVLAELLPLLAETGALIATDWSADPEEPEIDAADLAHLLRARLLDRFYAQAIDDAAVWLLRQGQHFGTIEIPGTGRHVLPVWSNRPDTRYGMDTLDGWSALLTASPEKVALREFTTRHLVACAERRLMVAPAFVAGPGVTTLTPWDLKAQLIDRGNPVMRVA